MLQSILAGIKRLPRGGFRIVKRLAVIDPRLQRWPVEAVFIGRPLQADLRYAVWYSLWKYGYLKERIGEDKLTPTVVRPGGVVWDVGGNIGYAALLYAKAVGPTGSVFAFEPGRRAFAELTRTVAGEPNIRPMNVAISDTSGRIAFSDNEQIDLSHVVRESDQATYEVESLTLDELVRRGDSPPPSFIKIDVEGHELEVLNGAAAVIRDALPIVQFESITLPERSRMVARLRELGEGRYHFFRIVHDATVLKESEWDHPQGSSNYLAMPPGALATIEGVMSDAARSDASGAATPARSN